MRRVLPNLHDALRHARRDSLIRNSLFMMSVTIITSALGFVYWLVAARVFSAADVGLAAALVSAMTFASILSNPGLQSVLVERLPRRASGREWALTANAAYAGGSATALLAGALCVVMLPLISGEFALLGRWSYAAAFVGGVWATTMATLLDYTWIAERATGKTLLRNLLFAAGKIPLVALPTAVAFGAFGVFASWSFSVAATVVIGLAVLPRLGRGYRPEFRGIAAEWRVMAGSTGWHHGINLGNLIPTTLLPVAVAAALSATDAAYFYATWRLAGIFFMVSPAVATSLFAEGSHGDMSLRRRTQSAARTTALLLGPALVGFLALGHWALSLFGAAYAEHGFLLLLLLVLSAVPDAVVNLYSSVLRVEGRLPFAAGISLAGAVLSVVLALLLMPSVGIAGAGVGWLVARVAGALVVLWDRVRVGGPQIERLRRILPTT